MESVVFDGSDVDATGDSSPSSSSEPEAILLRSDCILPTFYPPSTGLHRLSWAPRDVANTLATLSTLLVYVLPVFVFVCSAGNLILALGIRRLYPSVLSTSLYVFVALIVDSMVVWSRCGLEWLSAAAKWNLRETILSSSVVACKFFPFLTQFALQLSSWMTVAMAAETALVYQRPHALMRVCRLPRARLVVMATVASLAVANSSCFYSYSLPSSSSSLSLPGLCTSWATDQRAPWKDRGSISVGRDPIKIVLMTFDLLVTDLVPYFAVFSCVVMLVTKRMRRRDQVRQIDNTWKACNVDSSTAHQLHTSFIVVAIFHTVLLFPQLTYKTFTFVTDPQVTRLVPHAVVYRPAALTARTVCHLLQVLFLSAKVLAFLVACPAFRRECVAIFTCFRRGDDSSAVDQSVVSTSAADHGLPLLQPPPPPAVVIGDGCRLSGNPSPVCGGGGGGGGNSPEVKVDAALSSAAILENGAPCIKIFSMTSV